MVARKSCIILYMHGSFVLAAVYSQLEKTRYTYVSMLDNLIHNPCHEDRLVNDVLDGPS